MPLGKTLGKGWGGRDLRWGAAAGLVAFVAFNANGREIPSYDSQPAKYLAIEIAKNHTLTLDATVARIPQLGERPGFAIDTHGRRRTAYPLPSALTAGAVAWLMSISGVVDLDAPLAANFVAKLTASSLAALAVVVVFFIARRRLTHGQATLIALGFGLGTNVWGSVSQTLWQQETAFFTCLCAILLMEENAPSVPRLAAVGVLLGVTGWARPQLTVTVLLLCVGGCFMWRTRALWCVAPLGAVGAIAIAINIAWFGHPLGAMPALEALHPTVHGVSGSVTSRPWIAAAGLLVSPSRGLLVFSPIVAVSFFAFRRALRSGPRRLPFWCCVAAVVQLLLYSTYGVWWGGHTYGPRYALDMLPSLLPLAAMGLPLFARRRWSQGVAVLALGISVLTAGAGAFVYPNEGWNSDPDEIDHDHDRLWDWRDSQLWRTLHASPSPQNFALFSKDAVRND